MKKALGRGRTAAKADEVGGANAPHVVPASEPSLWTIAAQGKHRGLPVATFAHDLYLAIVTADGLYKAIRRLQPDLARATEKYEVSWSQAESRGPVQSVEADQLLVSAYEPLWRDIELNVFPVQDQLENQLADLDSRISGIAPHFDVKGMPPGVLWTTRVRAAIARTREAAVGIKVLVDGHPFRLGLAHSVLGNHGGIPDALGGLAPFLEDAHAVTLVEFRELSGPGPLLTPRQVGILNVLRALPENGRMLGKHIVDAVKPTDPHFSTNVLGITMKPLVASYGVRNQPAKGYYLDRSHPRADPSRWNTK